MSPFPEAPPGTTPNALAVSPDGHTLAVANADNNTVAMIDIAQPGRSEVEGFIPTGLVSDRRCCSITPARGCSC